MTSKSQNCKHHDLERREHPMKRTYADGTVKRYVRVDYGCMECPAKFEVNEVFDDD